MIKKLVRLINQIGIVAVADELGYRSTQTIRNWIKQNRVPQTAQLKVQSYLKGKRL